MKVLVTLLFLFAVGCSGNDKIVIPTNAATTTKGPVSASGGGKDGAESVTLNKKKPAGK
jgi:hypothetical protein